jgi:hypothetical protein
MKNLARMATAAVVAAGCLAFAAPAGAATSPGYSEFSDCPDKSVNAGIAVCQRSIINGGNIKLGSKNTPIVDPIELTVSVDNDGNTFLGKFDGGRQQVPGGLVGISGLDWLIYLFPNSLLGLYAETELAGPVGNVFQPRLALPIKVRLDNPILTSNCYIGSNTNPISLMLTTGTTNPPPPNTPISGHDGTTSSDPVLPGVFRSDNILLVDNEFAVPAASGCGLLGLGLIDALVNAQAGLPSAAGKNEAKQESDAALGVIEAIYQPAGYEL